MKAYSEARAREYDDWYEGRGRFANANDRREARRVAPELVVVDAALRDGVQPEEWQERVLNDGSRWTVFKRYFAPEALVTELGGGEVLHAGRWFVVVRSPAA